jgi:hypothetical protein
MEIDHDTKGRPQFVAVARELEPRTPRRWARKIN